MMPVETVNIDDREGKTCSTPEVSFLSNPRQSPASQLALRGDNVMKEKPEAALPGLHGRTPTYEYNKLHGNLNERPKSIQPRVECTLEEVHKFPNSTHPELKM